LGGDIDGEFIADNSGYSVSMNAAGDRIAIGAPYNSGAIYDTNLTSGSVRVYRLDTTTLLWVPLGQDIDGETTTDTSGYSVSMNEIGDRVAIGAPYNNGNGDYSGSVRVYLLNTTTSLWDKLGNDIDGNVGNISGHSVSINAIGDRVAIGAIGTGTNSGSVQVYKLNTTTSPLRWDKLGNGITGVTTFELSGYSVSINAIGDRIAIGAIAATDSGCVRVYKFNNTTLLWVPLGQDIYGEASNDTSGFSVSMNAIGDRVAIGGPYNDSNGLNSGSVRVYELNLSDLWVQLGGDIDGEANSDQSGYSVSMNADGNRVAIGAPLNGGLNNAQPSSGSVRVYELNTTTSPASWVQLGNDIDGKASGNRFGSSVSMNAIGDRVGMGAIVNEYYNTANTKMNSAQVYELGTKSIIKSNLHTGPTGPPGPRGYQGIPGTSSSFMLRYYYSVLQYSNNNGSTWINVPNVPSGK
jgi:hypothetical protein